ncbi:Hypothetical protein POVR2_LOCUS69, partial [uncultured virus]
VLCLSEHWPSVIQCSKQQDWWKERVEFLVGKPLQARRGNWSGVYRDNDLIVPVLLELGLEISSLASALDEVVLCNNVAALKLFLADTNATLASHHNLVVIAIREGSTECLSMLLEDSRVNCRHMHPVREAVYYCQPAALRLLLANNRSDPGDWQNEAIKIAARRAALLLRALGRMIYRYVQDAYGTSRSDCC